MSRSKDRGWDHGNYCRFGRKVCDVKPPSTIVVGDVVNVLLTDGDFVGEMTGFSMMAELEQ